MKKDDTMPLTVQGETQIVRVAQAEPSAMQLLDHAITQGAAPEALEKLYNLKVRIDTDKARAAFATAFVALQSELPVIHATKSIHGKNGEIRSSYAPYEEIMRQVAPLLKRHGFTVSFSKKIDQGRVSAFCTLMHSAGHEKTNEYQVRIGQGPPGCSESQADGAAHMYAMRGALRDALGITVAGLDEDAREIGAPVTPDQAEDLYQRVLATKTNEKVFLKFATAQSFETIPANRYKELVELLEKKSMNGTVPA